MAVPSDEPERGISLIRSHAEPLYSGAIIDIRLLWMNSPGMPGVKLGRRNSGFVAPAWPEFRRPSCRHLSAGRLPGRTGANPGLRKNGRGVPILTAGGIADPIRSGFRTPPDSR